MDGQIDGLIDGQTDRWMDIQIDDRWKYIDNGEYWFILMAKISFYGDLNGSMARGFGPNVRFQQGSWDDLAGLGDSCHSYKLVDQMVVKQ